jgi:16S rRNA (guanine966-N2)-methyltransferase
VRVIAGSEKGKKLKAPPKTRGVRPLTDQAKEALFNILGEKVVDSTLLDLFAGTGAVGIEALSRGAKIAIFVELHRPVSALIRENLTLTGFLDRSEIYVVDVMRALNLLGSKGAKFDVVFLGAPYDSPVLEKALIKLSELEMLNPDGLIIAEHRKQHMIAESYGRYIKCRDARYGETVLSFYKER